MAEVVASLRILKRSALREDNGACECDGLVGLVVARVPKVVVVVVVVVVKGSVGGGSELVGIGERILVTIGALVLRDALLLPGEGAAVVDDVVVVVASVGRSLYGRTAVSIICVSTTSGSVIAGIWPLTVLGTLLHELR